MATILVTGGAGFIGSHLVEALVAQGERVRVLDDLSTGRMENLAGVIDQIELIETNITDVETVYRATARIFNCEADPLYAPARSGDVLRSYADSSQAGALLGWQAQVSFETGLKRLVETYARM